MKHNAVQLGSELRSLAQSRGSFQADRIPERKLYPLMDKFSTAYM
jgi:hypothetical protein